MLLAADVDPLDAGALAALIHGLAAARVCPGGPIRARDVALTLPGVIADALRPGRDGHSDMTGTELTDEHRTDQELTADQQWQRGRLTLLPGVSAQVIVDLDAIAANVATLRSYAGSAGLMAVVKGDGYGHGLLPSARAAIRGGADWLATAQLG